MLKGLHAFLFAVAAVAVATAIRYALNPWLGGSITYGLFFLAIAVTAIYTGFWPAAFATFLATAGVAYFFLEPFGFAVQELPEQAGLLLFVLVALVISYVGHIVQRAQRNLERRVQQVHRQAALIDLSPDAIITQAIDGTILTWSRGAEKLYGWTKEEVVGRTINAVLKTEFSEPLEKIVARLEAGEGWTGELVHYAKDGRKLTVQSYWHLEQTDTELEILESNIDITERKRAEEAIRESEAKFRALSDSIPVLIWQCDANRNCNYFNKARLEFTGRSLDEECGSGWTEGLHPEDRERVLSAYNSAVERREPFEMEYRLRHHSGEYRWIIDRGVPQFRSDGWFIGYLGGCVDVTDRKQAEAALRTSEELLRAVFESSSDCILVWDRQYNYLYANQPAIDHVGTTRDKVIGKNIRDGLGHIPDFMHLWMGRVDRAFATGESFRVEDAVGVGDRLVSSESQISPIRDAGGQVFAVGVVYRDVSQRKKAEEALRESEEFLRRVIDTVPSMVFIKDWEGRFILVNEALARVYGTTPIDIVGKTDANFNSKTEELERFRLDDREVISSRNMKLIPEEPVTHASGETHWYCTVKVPLVNKDGTCHQVMGVSLDITARKEAEEALRRSELFYRQTLESIPGMVFTTRTDGYCDYQSQQWVDYTGVPMEEHLGDGWNKLLHPEDRPRAFAAWRAAVEEKAPYDLEYRVRRYDGLYEWFKVRGEPIRDENGLIVRWFGVAANIQSLKHAEEALKAAQVSAEGAKAAAERANSAKDEFLAVLSHELRTPLTPVLAATQLMERTGDLSEKTRQLVDVIRRNLELETRLIDDLLDLTRIVRGKIALDKRTVNICTVLERVADVCKPDIEAKRLHFGVDLREPPHPVMADEARLQQVLWNLLKNSIKFTPEGGCVGIRGFRLKGELIIEVNDSGIGIAPEALSRIFNAFEQEDRRITRQFGGLGLGLAITKRLVELHDGTITAESAGINKGATFRITMPIAKQSPAEAETKTEKARSQSPDVSRRILLTEDHTDTALMMKTLLEDAGYEVETAADVAQALEAAGEREFDLLISDLGLPDGSGLDLMEKLRARPKPLKGIALSGFGREEDISRSKEAGFVEHLTKPVDVDALLATVERVI